MNKPLLMILVACTCTAAFSPPSAGQADDVEEVHQLLDRIEKAWIEQDRDALEQVCYDDDLLVIRSVLSGSKEGAYVLLKRGYVDRIAGLWKRAGLKRRFTGRDISVHGDVAWMQLSVADRATGRRYSTGEFLALAVRREGAWKLCFSMHPLFVRQAVLVTEVLSGSQAERVGIKVGDVAHACGNWLIQDSATLRRWETARPGEEADAKSPLIVIRGSEYLRFEVVPGELGVRLEDRLLPKDGAVLLEAQQSHPIKEILEIQLAATKSGDVGGWYDHLCPQGYFSVEQRESGPLMVLTRDNFRERWDDGLPPLREEFDLPTAELHDVRLIVAGDIALVSSRVELVRRDGDSSKIDAPVGLKVFVRKYGRWWLASVLSKRIEIGLHVGAKRYSAEETARRKARLHGQFVGVGLGIAARAKGIQIQRVFPDSGAARAGLQADEIIIEIDGEPTKGMTVEEAVKLLTGPEGSTVRLNVHSTAGKLRTVFVARTVIVVSGVESRLLSDNIGLIQIRSFTEETAAHVHRALKEFSAQGVVGLVLDLREGGGGPLTEIVKVIELFVPRGKTLFYIQDSRGELQVVKSKRKRATKLPVAVLIDAKSGGELLAAALKRARRATLVGHRTPGVTANRQLVEHPDGSSEVVAHGQLFITQQIPITGRGISPDVPMPADATPEEVLGKATKLLRSELEAGSC